MDGTLSRVRRPDAEFHDHTITERTHRESEQTLNTRTLGP